MSENNTRVTLWTAAIAFGAGVLVAVLWFTMADAGGMPVIEPAPGALAEGEAGDGMAMQTPPADVRLDHAQIQTLRQRMALTGRLRELRRATVAAEVEGKVLAVPVQEGDPVIGGKTVLAEIDGIWAQQDLKRAEAQVAAAQATLDQSLLDLDYLEQLLEAQSAKPREVEDKRAQVASNHAQLSAAIADRDRVEREVERLVVLAPFDGVVTRKITEVGQWVAPGNDIVEVVSVGQLDAVVDVPERVIDQAKLGDVAQISVDPLGLAVSGEVVAINPDGINAARAFPVKIRLDDQKGQLKPGMSVTVWLPIGPEHSYLTVPQDAVLYTADGQTVWVGVPGKGSSPMPTAVPVSVKPMFTDQSRVAVEVLSDDGMGVLVDGAVVVVEGAEGLFPGRPLNDVNAAPPQP